MHKEVTAYQSSAGNLYIKEESAAAEELMALSKPEGTSAEQIGRDQAAKLVANRRKVIAVLERIDFKADSARS